MTHAALCSSGSGKPYCDCGAEVRALREELAKWEASPIVARMHPDDGRIVNEQTYAHAATSGGASWLSVKDYTIKLVAARKGEGE